MPDPDLDRANPYAAPADPMRSQPGDPDRWPSAPGTWLAWSAAVFWLGTPVGCVAAMGVGGIVVAVAGVVFGVLALVHYLTAARRLGRHRRGLLAGIIVNLALMLVATCTILILLLMILGIGKH